MPAIPVFLRALVHRLSGIGSVHRLAQRIYHFAARAVAVGFRELPGVREVRLRGGLLKRCVPAVSDIDFTVLVEEIDPCTINRLRALYRRQKRRFPMLGEIIVTTVADENILREGTPAVALLYEHALRFERRTWEPVHLPPKHPPSEPSRFALSLNFFHKARRHWDDAQRGYRRYHLAHFRRDIGKAIRFAAPQQPVCPDESPEVLIERTLELLEAMAPPSSLRGGEADEATLGVSMAEPVVTRPKVASSVATLPPRNDGRGDDGKGNPAMHRRRDEGWWLWGTRAGRGTAASLRERVLTGVYTLPGKLVTETLPSLAPELRCLALNALALARRPLPDTTRLLAKNDRGTVDDRAILDARAEMKALLHDMPTPRDYL